MWVCVCRWVGNCVGYANHKYFIQFLAYAAVSGLYVGLMLIGPLLDAFGSSVRPRLCGCGCVAVAVAVWLCGYTAVVVVVAVVVAAAAAVVVAVAVAVTVAVAVWL